MQPLKDIKKIVRFCQKNGILKYKDGDFEIDLKELPVPKRVGDGGLEKNTAVPDFPSWDSLTPEQKLLWSATPDISDVG